MKLLTIGSLPPEWGGPVRGGVATFHAALLSGFLERQADIQVIGTLPPTPLTRDIPVPVYVRPEGITRAAFYEDLLERICPDAVLMNHIAHTIGVTHARLGSPVPALGVIQSWHNVTFRSGEERQRACDVTQEALSGLAAMVAVSSHMVDEGKGLDFEYPAVVETIHNPVPPLYMTADVEVDAHERSGVLFLGRLTERKNPAGLVEAATLLPDLAVLLVGQGNQEDELRALIDELGVGGRVRLAQPARQEDHLDWIRQALLRTGVMCLPSRSEGLPLAFVEALACGTPIVGFGPAVREVRDAAGVEVGEPLDSGTPEEIAAALERVLAVDWDRQRLRRAALAAFGLDRAADRYLELLTRITSRGDGMTIGADRTTADLRDRAARRDGEG